MGGWLNGRAGGGASDSWGIHAKQEEITVDLPTLLRKNFSRPLKLLVAEPIVLLVSIYTAFVYAILYLFLVSYPVVFAGVRGWDAGHASLPYTGMVVGMVLGGILVVAFQPWTNRRARAAAAAHSAAKAAEPGPAAAEVAAPPLAALPVPPPAAAAVVGRVRPEDRLVPCMIGAVLFPVGLFWFSWAGADPNVHWIVPALAGIPLGLGQITIFLQCLNYLIDAYVDFAASAIAANTVLRSAVAAAFPFVGRFLFVPPSPPLSAPAPPPSPGGGGRLGIGWAGSLLGFLALAMVPIPLVFFLKGERIRRKSRWAPTH